MAPVFDCLVVAFITRVQTFNFIILTNFAVLRSLEQYVLSIQSRDSTGSALIVTVSHRNRQFYRPKTAPSSRVKARVTASVRDTLADGRGVATTEQGQVVFVPGAWPGEEVVIDVTAPKRGPATGSLVSVLTPSTARVTPSCRYANDGQCGGCPWSFVEYEAQVEQKISRLQSSLDRLGSTADIQLVSAPSQIAYRNRAQFKSDGQQLGYLAAKTHRIVDVECCEVLSPDAAQQLRRLRSQLPNPEWSSRRGWTTLDIDDQVDEPSVNQRPVFRQANTQQNQAMKDWLRSQLRELPSVEHCLELFCGAGNLTEVLSESLGAEIMAAEGQGAAIEVLSAKELERVTPVTVDLFDDRSFARLLADMEPFDAVVLDPPRDGLKCSKPLMGSIKGVQWIIYISCDQATWERDIGLFQAEGFRLDHVTLLDMFPQTPHMEILSICRR